VSATQDRQIDRLAAGKPVKCITDFIGRGSWIRTNDLQYPKLISDISQSVLQLPEADKTLCLLTLLAPEVS
jgi:hypothetical protein